MNDDIRTKLAGSILKDDDPFGPAAPLEDWSAETRPNDGPSLNATHNDSRRTMTEIVFIVEEHEDGQYAAKAVSDDIVAHSNSRKGIEQTVRQAVLNHFQSAEPMPALIHLHYVHDKTIGLAEPQDASESARYPLRGKQPYRFDDPFSPVGLEDWDLLK